MLDQIIVILGIITSILLIILIIIQSKGTGLGSAFGGDMGFYSTKRGAEKMIFTLTIIISALFLLLSLVSVLIK